MFIKVLKWIGLLAGSLLGLLVLTGMVLYFIGKAKFSKRYDVPIETVSIPTEGGAVQRGEHLAAIFGEQGSLEFGLPDAHMGRDHPQPYVTNPEISFRSRLCSAGTVTKNQGAGPRQNQILPLNSMFIGTVYQNLKVIVTFTWL